MLGRRRKPEGFVWQTHLATRVLRRREKRAQQVEAVRAAVDEAGQKLGALAADKIDQAGAIGVQGLKKLGSGAAVGAVHAKASVVRVAREVKGRTPGLIATLKAKAHQVARAVILLLPERRAIAERLAALPHRFASNQIGALAVVFGLGGGTLALIAATTIFSDGQAPGKVAAERPVPGLSRPATSSSAPTSSPQSSWFGLSWLGLSAGRAPIVGTARALSGGTISLAGERLSLDGIDAPEAAQPCLNLRGRTWACAETARQALTRRLRGTAVTCAPSAGSPSAGFLAARCTAGGIDVTLALLDRGLVVATARADEAQRDAERSARDAKRGLWGNAANVAPAEFRQRAWAEAAAQRPDGCPIKATVARGNRIYLMPWSSGYRAARVRPAEGGRWFCSEDEAIEAGWKRA